MSSNNYYSSSSSSLPPFIAADSTKDTTSAADMDFNTIATNRSSSTVDGTNDNNHIASNNGMVQLNVGGTIHTTSLSTLNRIPGTFFEAMVSGRHRLPTIAARSDGARFLGTCVGFDEGPAHAHTTSSPAASYFIDRDGKHFRHILNYLRCGTVVSLPQSDHDKNELAIEADFYGLNDLLLAIQRPPLDVNEHLPAPILKIQEEERSFRSKFVGGFFRPNSVANPSLRYMGLISLFGANGDGFEGTPVAPECPLRYNAAHPLRQDPSCIYLSVAESRIKEDSEGTKRPQYVTVATLEKFVKNFNKIHPNILHRIRDILRTENVIIAGGSVLHALTANQNIRTGRAVWGQTSDIDLFFYGMYSKQQANELVRRIFLALAVDHERWVIVRCQGVINLHNESTHNEGTKIQIILRLYDTPTEVLFGFDVDCCGCCFTGDDVKITKRCHSALVSGINVLNPLHAWPQKASYELRLGKYATRGFAVYVPGLPKHRIGYGERIQKSKLKHLKGLARLVKVDMEMNTACPIKCRQDPWTGQIDSRTATPREIRSLRESVVGDLTPSECIADRLVDFYSEDSLGDVLVPAIYGIYGEGGRPIPFQWFEHDFQLSSSTRDVAIETILDCSNQENVPNCIPRKLEDAWRLEKRSREYLNDAMEKVDVDTIYYSPIFEFCNGDSNEDNMQNRKRPYI